MYIYIYIYVYIYIYIYIYIYHSLGGIMGNITISGCRPDKYHYISNNISPNPLSGGYINK